MIDNNAQNLLIIVLDCILGDLKISALVNLLIKYYPLCY
jgi:hypothetical protein